MIIRPPAYASSADPGFIIYPFRNPRNPRNQIISRNLALRNPIFRPRAWPLRCSAHRSEDGVRQLAMEVESTPGIDCATIKENRMSVGVGSPSLPARIGIHRMTLGDQAFFLLAFIACTTSVAFTSLVVAAVPTLCAMKRAANSLAKLADTAREELPSTMAAIRLSGMEISDLTLELSELSQEIADGVNKSAQAVQAAEAGIKQIGSIARRKTISMIQERENLPSVSLQPLVAGAAKKTSLVVGQAKKTLMNIIYGGESNAEQESTKVE
ncbi:hypothetical protein J5N97_020543 [Dioscorea zingiberensis]|uniref:Uncharacterized protein n=1 Tax=Dioscorea zingiberensis TaxID=325984 RepID=A0A9D5CGT4_9LILI|nr:hypothetical protein J5N97_020543 [Dioscorea zingiberensis]